MAMITGTTMVGQEFAGKPKKLTCERLWAFSGGAFDTPDWPKKNIHTNLEFARSTGLDRTYASATQYLGYVTELMADLFGEDWFRGGKLGNAKFIKPVTEGDTITVKARVESKDEGNQITRYVLDVWCENQNADKVLFGTATGEVR